MYIDLANTDRSWRQLYHLFISCVNPRPIALVSTVSTTGVANLAPYSFFNMVAGKPPVLMVCPALRRDGRPKDTLTNIRETGEFVVAIVTEAIAEAMACCAADLPQEASEFDFSGLSAVPAQCVKPSLVRESPVNIECRLREVVELGQEPGSGNVIFGDLVALHVADWVLADDGQAADPHKLRTVGRLGGKWYCTVADPYELEIPTV